MIGLTAMRQTRKIGTTATTQTAIGAATALALMFVACGAATPTPVAANTSVQTPMVPAEDSVVTESVRAYLHTFKLNEKELPAGLTIPYGGTVAKNVDGSLVGVARATGKIGPRGHQVYELFALSYYGDSVHGASYMANGHLFAEIAPEPPDVPAAPPAPSSGQPQ